MATRSSARSHRMDIIGNLPVELVFKITEDLDFKDLLAFQGVSRTWYGLVNCDFIWRRFLPSYYPRKEIHYHKAFRWMIITPCETKLEVLNHYRVLKNWRENSYYRFQMKNTDFITSYDGKTLVTSTKHPNNGFSVWLIERGKVWLKQTLKLNSPVYALANNSSYIVAFSGAFIFVYGLDPRRKRMYKIAYILKKSDLVGIEKLSDGQMAKVLNNKDRSEPNISEAMKCFIVKDTLFGYFQHLFRIHSPARPDQVYAWDLKNEKLLLFTEIEIIRGGFSTDGNQVYCSSKHKITVYNCQGEEEYAVEHVEGIRKVMINDNLLVALVKRDYPVADIIADRGRLLDRAQRIVGYDKRDGKQLFKREDKTAGGSLFHPHSDVIYDISDESLVYAIEPSTGKELWSAYMHDTALGHLLDIAGERFLLVMSFSGDQYHAYDVHTGEFKYCMFENDCYGLTAFYDIILFYDIISSTVVVQVYS